MNSRTASFEFISYKDSTIRLNTTLRAGETKIGQELQNEAVLPEHQFLILGISEDLGPQANGGLAGSKTAFHAFMKRFLNVQANEFLSGKSIFVAGEIISNYDFQNADDARDKLIELDEFVESILTTYLSKHPNLIPIVIGGGHNNAYPIIKAICSLQGNTAINVVNLDPHADFRALEGRHSGNSFSYAYEDGLLEKYGVIGLHQSYNSQAILDALRKCHFNFTFFEDYMLGNADFEKDLADFLSYVSTKKFGVELDLDAIKDIPSSAMTPSGFTIEQARKYVNKMGSSKNAAYFHLPEAAPKTERDMVMVGKTLGYLVADFIKAQLRK